MKGAGSGFATVIHPAAVQKSVLHPPIHVTCSAPEGTAISFAAACLTSVIAAKARDARGMYSVSIVGFGAEHGSTADVFDVPQITQHRQTFSIQMLRHQVGVVDSATDLLDPGFFPFGSTHKDFVSMCLMAPLPLRRASPRAAAASVQIRT